MADDGTDGGESWREPRPGDPLGERFWQVMCGSIEFWGGLLAFALLLVMLVVISLPFVTSTESLVVATMSLVLLGGIVVSLVGVVLNCRRR
jgi:hypothetical protein